MSTRAPKSVKSWLKKASVTLFAILFFLNLGIVFTENNSKGDISLFGISLTFFQATLAEPAAEEGVLVYWEQYNKCRCEPTQLPWKNCSCLWSWYTC